MLNLAVVGLGTWGRRHVESATSSGRFKVAKGVDPADVEFDFPVTGSLDHVLNDPGIDAVSIATPHTLHTEQITRCARAGKHVLTEKPFALSGEDAGRCIQAANESGVVLAVGHDQRFYPSILAMNELIRSGKLGTTKTIDSHLSHDFIAKRAEADRRADQSETCQPDRDTWWRLNLEEAPAGPMVHLGIHHLDLFIHLFGEIQWVMAQSPGSTFDAPFPDTMLVMLKFVDGRLGTISSSLSSPLNAKLLVTGSDGWAEAYGPSDEATYRLSSMDNLKHRLGGAEPSHVEYPAVDSVRANFSAFADAIEGVAPYPIPTEQMAHNAAVLEAIVESSRSGDRVAVGR